jgi:phage gp29-like protein
MSKNFHTAAFNHDLLESIFRTSKKTIQEYVAEIERTNRYKSVRSNVENGTVLDDRSRLMDLYDACLQQDTHIRAVIETLVSQILGDRYMLARQNEKGKYIKDVAETQKIQGSQFDKIIRGIVEAKLFGYTLLEIMPGIDPRTGKLAEVNVIERRNVLADQRRVVQRQGIWLPGWDLTEATYSRNYILVNTGDLGLFSATTPLILAKKFTVANYVNFSHTYGQPIIHGKTVSESNADRKRLANDIANAAQNKVLVTGLDDEIDIKTFTMSNSEKIYTSLIEFVNREVSNMILGSESMAGATQSYVGSTKAHQDIFRERIEVYRRFIENVMNEEVVPRLVAMGYIPSGLEFKYSNRIEMNNEDRIKLYGLITDKYEVTADEIEKEFGIHVGRQLNAMEMSAPGGNGGAGYGSNGGSGDRHVMSDEEYYRRYGRSRGSRVANFLRDAE